VAITSPIGTVTVQPEGERLVARVRLGPGDNVVEAECRKDGVRRGTPSIASNSASLEIQPDYYHASDFFGAFRSCDGRDFKTKSGGIRAKFS